MSDYKVKFVDYPAQYKAHKKELDTAWQKVMEGGDFILREDVEKFEKNLADYVGTKYALGVNSGTDALTICIKALGISFNNEVITSSHTFWATIEAIENCKARAVLTDTDNGLMNMDDVHYAISRATRAIIPVHIAGSVCDMERLKFIADSQHIPIIEDAAQALGAVKPIGLAQCFSFYPAKILGGIGDGGAITTNDEDFYNLCKLFRNHGGKPQPQIVGFNSRLDNIQAAILNVKIKYLPEVLLMRKQIADRYNKGLTGLVELPKERLVYQDYIIYLPQRDTLKSYLEKEGIETMVNEYPFPHFYEKGPKTIKYEKETLRLPCNETLTDSQIDYVIEKIRSFFAQ